MKQYQNLVNEILLMGEVREDRTGTGTISIFSHQMEFDMADGFPILTTKDMRKSFENFKGEMLWLLEGNTNAKYLAEKYGFKIWRKWQKDQSGDLGRVYGAQWRGFRGISTANGVPKFKQIDQIQYLLNELKENPYSRRMLLSAWNPAELEDMALPPCHWSFELYVSGREMDTLNLKLHQRSCDVFLGVPYNIGEYALLLHMIAHVTGLKAGRMIHDMTNVHIYLNHLDQVNEQVLREPFDLPALWINPEVKDLHEFTMDDLKLVGYECHGELKGDVSV